MHVDPLLSVIYLFLQYKTARFASQCKLQQNSASLGQKCSQKSKYSPSTACVLAGFCNFAILVISSGTRTLSQLNYGSACK